jgi:hypothetical protein
MHFRKRSNSGLQRSWPLFAVHVASVEVVDFGGAFLLPHAGHAAESQCYTAAVPTVTASLAAINRER